MLSYIDQTHVGYYDVTVATHSGVVTRRVYATSDYAAALKVREVTGIMPRSQNDVIFVESPMKSLPVGAMIA